MYKRQFLNSEYVSVVYADLEEQGFEMLQVDGLVFSEDSYAGVFNTRTDILLDMLNKANPVSSILEMASHNEVHINTVSGEK